jgi:hypothetical protein
MKCVACRKDAPTVTDAELAGFHPQVSDWEIAELDGIKRLRRIFSFDDFAQALKFTQKVGELAEEEGASPRAADRMGEDDGHMVDAQNQGPASQRFRHGGENGRAVSVMNRSVRKRSSRPRSRPPNVE